MIAPVLHSLKQWLNDTTVVGKGVNNFVTSTAVVPLVSGHSAPPLITFFGNPMDDECVASWTEPPSYPALYITAEGPSAVEAEVATHNRDAHIIVGLHYIVREANRFKSVRDWYYTAEAVHHSLMLYLAEDSDGKLLGRTLMNKHILLARDKATYGPWYEEVGQAIGVGVFLMELQVRNTQP